MINILMRLELGQFNLFDSSIRYTYIHQLNNKANLYKGRQAQTWDGLLKLTSYTLQNGELHKLFWNPTYLSITRLHYFSYSTTPTMKLAFVLFLCTLRILLSILHCAPYWLTHLIIFWVQNENIPLVDHTNRIILKQFHPGWNHKTQTYKRRGHRMLYLKKKVHAKAFL